MSLNRTLDRLFDVIRREARRNPAFADQLDAVLRAHLSRREVDDEALERAHEPAAPPVKNGKAKPLSAPAPMRIELNPVALYLREGEEALRAELEEPAYERDALLTLVSEHNLDPGGEAGGLERADLAELIVARARRRAERDRKLFDY
ncbi:MAG: hypothetical protein GC189_06485 [Alphaproteobacteria bacterium]|nr:hypothetical protein [Alphaproteobacteria bacterium]